MPGRCGASWRGRFPPPSMPPRRRGATAPRCASAPRRRPTASWTRGPPDGDPPGCPGRRGGRGRRHRRAHLDGAGGRLSGRAARRERPSSSPIPPTPRPSSGTSRPTAGRRWRWPPEHPPSARGVGRGRRVGAGGRGPRRRGAGGAHVAPRSLPQVSSGDVPRCSPTPRAQRGAQDRPALPCQPPLLDTRRDARVAMVGGRRPGALAAAVPPARPGGVHATLLPAPRAVIASRFDPARPAGSSARSARRDVRGPGDLRAAGRLGWRPRRAGLGSLRLLVSGSAPLSAALARGSRRRRAAAARALRHDRERPGRLQPLRRTSAARERSAFRLPGVELATADRDGNPVGGEDGEIAAPRAPGLRRLPGRRGGDRGRFHPGGWFRTGDLGRRRSRRRFPAITGRAKELIITGGMNVYPREVAVGAGGRPRSWPGRRWSGSHPSAGARRSSRRRPAADARVDEEGARLRRRTARPYKRPKRVVVVDALPVNPMGKVISAEVARLAREAGGG